LKLTAKKKYLRWKETEIGYRLGTERRQYAKKRGARRPCRFDKRRIK